MVDLSCNHTVVALGKIPVYRIDRAGAAPLGGSLMVATGVLSLEEAYRAVDFNTNVLLLGMMIVGIKFLGLFQGGCATHDSDYCVWAFEALRRFGRTQRYPRRNVRMWGTESVRIEGDLVAKVFLGWRTKILRAADAFYEWRREGHIVSSKIGPGPPQWR